MEISFYQNTNTYLLKKLLILKLSVGVDWGVLGTTSGRPLRLEEAAAEIV